MTVLHASHEALGVDGFVIRGSYRTTRSPTDDLAVLEVRGAAGERAIPVSSASFRRDDPNVDLTLSTFDVNSWEPAETRLRFGSPCTALETLCVVAPVASNVLIEQGHSGAPVVIGDGCGALTAYAMIVYDEPGGTGTRPTALNLTQIAVRRWLEKALVTP